MLHTPISNPWSISEIGRVPILVSHIYALYVRKPIPATGRIAEIICVGALNNSEEVGNSPFVVLEWHDFVSEL
jgi:hypothetical protein